MTLPSREDVANRDWLPLVAAMNDVDPTREWRIVDLAGGCFGLWGERGTSLVWVSTLTGPLPYAPADLAEDDGRLIIGVWPTWDTTDGTPDWADAAQDTVIDRPATLTAWAPAIHAAIAS